MSPNSDDPADARNPADSESSRRGAESTESTASADSSTSLPEGELSYEAAREELVQVVARLESGGVSLAESMELWERGEKLADTCQQWLDGARAKVEAARRRDTAPED